MERVEIAIIGSGPAGISAAITAKIREKKLLLFGKKELSKKVRAAHEIQNYPGLPAITGEAFAAAFANHLEQMDISVLEKQVTAIYAMGDYYAIQAENEMYEATTVILAGGVSQSRQLPGEEALLGRGVSYCATCDAQLYRGKKVAVLAYHEEAAAEAEFLAEVASEVVYFPQKGVRTPVHDKIAIVENLPTAIAKDTQGMRVETGAESYQVDGVFVLRDSVAPAQLVPGIAVEGAHVAVNLQMETNLPGCFACGDLVGTPYQYIKAAGQGNVAALSAVSYLAQQKRKAEGSAVSIDSGK